MRLNKSLNPSQPPFFKGGRALRGFTLIELLIVIVIISIIASFAVLSININQNKRLESIAHQLANILTLAQQEAMLRPATLGLVISKDRYQFYHYHHSPNPDETPWQPLSDNLLGQHAIPDDVQITLKMHGKKVSSDHPKVILSTSGDMTPFVILIGKRQASPLYQINMDANGNLKVGQVSYEE